MAKKSKIQKCFYLSELATKKLETLACNNCMEYSEVIEILLRKQKKNILI